MNQGLVQLERTKFIQQLPLLLHRAGELGLYKTMHALTNAVRVSGFELAEEMQAKEAK